MHILMFTNTFAPQIGGVTRSVMTLRAELLRRNHRVLVIAPAYKDHERDEPGILRIPSIGRLGTSDYSMPIPMSRHVRDEIEAFDPAIVHSHHPFLLGDTALRTAASLGLPSVYTYHTRYEFYLGDKAAHRDALVRLMRSLATGYANIADAVIAPSENLRDLIRQQGVVSPVHVIPTGIDLAHLQRGDRAAMRRRLNLREQDFVVGHLGRLSAEKNLEFLADAVVDCLQREPATVFAVSGYGPEKAMLTDRVRCAGLTDRVRVIDTLDSDDLAAFYAALDVFAFASLSETQGLVVAEAMAAGTPVVALDAPGVADAVGNNAGGVLLDAGSSRQAFADALIACAHRTAVETQQQREAARRAALRFSIENMGNAVEALYVSLCNDSPHEHTNNRRVWEAAWSGLLTELELMDNLFHAAGVAIRTEKQDNAS